MSDPAPTTLGRTAAPLPAWSGLLPVDKPGGVTSHDVVDRARRRLHMRSIGHLGTLDPAATGLLVLAIGAATRCATVWQGGRKTYEGVARFGVVTDTQDLQGRVLEQHEANVAEAAVRAAAQALTGELRQVPPMVSALKHEGKRLYEIARRGDVVEREPRAVRVDAWTWLDFAPHEARFVVQCSGGTYVRTLVHDLGAALGCGAALASLRRLRSEPFTLEQAIAWRDFDTVPAEALLERSGIPLDRALDVLPSVTLDGAAAESVGRGRFVPVVAGGAPVGAGERSIVLRDSAGRAIALAELVPAERAGGEAGSAVTARPNVVFPWAVREGKDA